MPAVVLVVVEVEVLVAGQAGVEVLALPTFPLQRMRNGFSKKTLPYIVVRLMLSRKDLMNLRQCQNKKQNSWETK